MRNLKILVEFIVGLSIVRLSVINRLQALIAIKDKELNL